MHEAVELPKQVALRRVAQRFEIGIARQHRLERIQQRDQSIDTLELHAVPAAGEQAIARRLQPVGQIGMRVDQGAETRRALGVGIVERRLGAQILRKGAHRLGQQQPPCAIVEQPRHDHRIGGVGEGAANSQNQVIGGIRDGGKILAHGEHEGEHAGHGQAQHPFAVSGDQPGPETGEGDGGDEDRRREARERTQRREEADTEERKPHDPDFLAQGIGAVADGNADRARRGGDAGVEAQRHADRKTRQANADRDRQPIFNMGPEHGQGYGAGKGGHLVLRI